MSLLEIAGLVVHGRKPTGEWIPTVTGFDLAMERGDVVARSWGSQAPVRARRPSPPWAMPGPARGS